MKVREHSRTDKVLKYMLSVIVLQINLVLNLNLILMSLIDLLCYMIAIKIFMCFIFPFLYLHFVFIRIMCNKESLYLFIIISLFQHPFIRSADQYKFFHVTRLLRVKARQEDAYLHGAGKKDTESHGARMRRYFRATSDAQFNNTACERWPAGLSK